MKRMVNDLDQCPDIRDGIAAEIKARGQMPPLWNVLMDKIRRQLLRIRLKRSNTDKTCSGSMEYEAINAPTPLPV